MIVCISLYGLAFRVPTPCKPFFGTCLHNAYLHVHDMFTLIYLDHCATLWLKTCLHTAARRCSVPLLLTTSVLTTLRRSRGLPIEGIAASPPQWYGSPGSTPFLSICKLLAAFLMSSLVFARSLQHFWLPASLLLGACYFLDDLRSTHTPSKYLRAT